MKYVPRNEYFELIGKLGVKKGKFDLVQVDGYSSYAYSDEQMAVFTYTEGDIYLTLFTDKVKYEAEKERTIKFYEEVML